MFRASFLSVMIVATIYFNQLAQAYLVIEREMIRK